MMSFTLLRPLCTAPFGLLLMASTVSAEVIIEERPLSQPASVVAAPVAPASAPFTPSTAVTTHSAAPFTPAPAPVEPTPGVVIETGTPNDNTGTPVPETSNNWQLYSQLQQMQQEMALLRGQVEEQGHVIERLQNDLRTRYTDLDQRLQLQQEQMKTPPAAIPVAPETNKTTAGHSADDEKKAYLAAYDTFRTGGPDKAIAPMQAFVKQFPDSSLTPGAYYWLGEFYLNASKADHAKARQQFDVVLSKYPDNAKAPAALYKIASILELQGKPDDTRQKMQELVKRYASSPEASLANTWLKQQLTQPQPNPTSAKPAVKPTTKPAVNKR
jgi:tol-pal system protein YbgF